MDENKIVFKVKTGEEGLKLRAYLKKVQKLSSRLIKGAALGGRLEIDNRRVKLNHIVKVGENISLNLIKEESQNISPEKMDIQVVYEDKDIIVVNKPPGIVVHPTRNYPNGTLANGIVYYFREKGENCIVRLVSRLDMGTSGLIIVGKNQFAHMCLARDMKCKDFEKSYIAVIHGKMEDDEGIIDLPIYRDEKTGIKRVVDERGQRSITRYKVIDNFKNDQLLRITLETGRTHQIRVHLSYLGHPLYGDTLYGTEDDSQYIKRQALHAYRLKFPHPRGNRIMELESDIPRDIMNLIEKIS
ncbi:RluA family pseudouridine synthase [Clostridium sp. MT-14]|mgnify:FL=1|uniref:Pseudouridine synthase n=1 Tax=Clostridium aromativorans TaxID=2836848 RepID=A0ABS8N2Z6_9CLOT|nr:MULTISPECIES: RluA family pseudouridine synthase [Clostridium]KAA8673327.1 RluA family pseudouridine synthase [Clostridium sp. HV4-5-A1G]MCC9294163.1 RluA family pseudouridine synthase [Clostridium aromativorans]CAB1240128.1 Pseudouridine synthase [Clostridiaceae bacterium BL-3]